MAGQPSSMEKATGISHAEIGKIYAIKNVRDKLKIVLSDTILQLKVACPRNFKQPTAAVIRETLSPMGTDCS